MKWIKRGQAEEMASFRKRLFRYTVVPVLLLGLLLTVGLYLVFRNAIVQRVANGELERITGIEANIHAAHSSVHEIGLRYLRLLRNTADVYETDKEELFLGVLTEQERVYVESIYLYAPDKGFTVIRPNSGWTRSVNRLSREAMLAIDPNVADMVRNYDQYYGTPVSRTIQGGGTEVYTYVLPLYSLARVAYNNVLIVNLSTLWLDAMLVLPSGEAYLLDQTNRVLSTNTACAFRTSMNDTLDMARIGAMDDPSGYLFGSYQGQNAIYIYARPDWISWKIVDVVLVGDVCPELDHLLVVSLGICLLLMGVCALLYWLLSRPMLGQLNHVFSQLNDMEKQSLHDNYILKQNYFNAVCQNLMPIEERDALANTLTLLKMHLRPDAPFRLIGLGLDRQTMDDVRDRLMEVAVANRLELYELNGEDAALIAQSEPGELTRVSDMLARLTLDNGWVVVSGVYDALSQLPRAVQEMSERLAQIRFWQVSRGLVLRPAAGDTADTAKLAALERQIAQAVRQRDVAQARRSLEDILALGGGYSYVFYRRFLVHLAFEAAFALGDRLTATKEERKAFSDLIGEGFVQTVGEARTVSEVRALFARAFDSMASQGARDGHEQIVEQACEYVRAAYPDPGLTMGNVAARFHLSGGYLGRLFLSCLGQSFADYLTEVRIDAAREQLTATDDAVETIAARVGCANTKYFYSLFKKKTQMTPREYRVRYAARAMEEGETP